jgi:pimeloyl-ACP methyl ester carboxylesterase
LTGPAAATTIAAMERAQVGDVELSYELLGEPGRPVVLLVNGLGGQLIGWDDELVALITAEGFRVLRFDNRDAGLSTEFPDGPALDFEVARRGERADGGYTLDDMADDASGLLRVLGIPAAHVVGVSMGGMIAQTLVIRHPDQVLSLASIMSTTGAPGVGVPSAEAMTVLMRPTPEDRSAVLDAEVASAAVIGSPAYPTPEAELRTRAGRLYDRSYRPAGVGRQLMAILVSGDRSSALGAVAVPTVVIHGDADPLVAPSGGDATAGAISGAQLTRIPGMGHDLPRPLWSQIVGIVVDNARRAEAATAGAAGP